MQQKQSVLGYKFEKAAIRKKLKPKYMSVITHDHCEGKEDPPGTSILLFLGQGPEKQNSNFVYD